MNIVSEAAECAELSSLFQHCETTEVKSFACDFFYHVVQGPLGTVPWQSTVGERDCRPG